MAMRTREITMPTPVSKKQEIINSIVTRIVSGDLRPGDPLPTAAELRAEYGVSITPVREAINWLKAAGYAVGVPGLRVYVAENPPRSDTRLGRSDEPLTD